MEFTDSLEGNLNILRDSVSELPPSQRSRARSAAVAIEKAVRDLQRDNPRDGIIGMGIALAVHHIAQGMVSGPKQQDGPIKDELGIIQLLS